MAGYHNNLALHISETTLKGRRRLRQQPRVVRVAMAGHLSAARPSAGWWVVRLSVARPLAAHPWAELRPRGPAPR